MRKMTRRMAMVLATMFITIALRAYAQDLASFEKRIHVEKLENGLTLVVMERHEAPVFSFFTHVDAGSSQEQAGQTGLAHMFEHMAFKGTEQIGTTNYAEEKKALEKVEATYHAYDLERLKISGRDDQKIAELEKAWKDAVTAADAFVVQNEFGEIIDREGGVGLNAFTSNDETGYFYSLPANRVELWAYLESERFIEPGDAGVLQRARCGVRRATDERRKQSGWTPDRAVSCRGFHGASRTDGRASAGQAICTVSLQQTPSASLPSITFHRIW